MQEPRLGITKTYRIPIIKYIAPVFLRFICLFLAAWGFGVVAYYLYLKYVELLELVPETMTNEFTSTCAGEGIRRTYYIRMFHEFPYKGSFLRSRPCPTTARPVEVQYFDNALYLVFIALYISEIIYYSYLAFGLLWQKSYFMQYYLVAMPILGGLELFLYFWLYILNPPPLMHYYYLLAPIFLTPLIYFFAYCYYCILVEAEDTLQNLNVKLEEFK